MQKNIDFKVKRVYNINNRKENEANILKKYLYEMHLHTKDTSNCANVKASVAVEEYIKAGYDGIVVTDHLSPSTYMKYGRELLPWKKKVDFFLRGYKAAKKAANGRIPVLLGMELRYRTSEGDNDYLVYGITEDFLYNTPELLNLNSKKFYELTQKNGFLVFQAHPFRVGMKVTNPKFLDGIEIFNGNPRHNSSNDIAEMWAKKYGLMVTSGSDYHEIEDLGTGGIYFNKDIKDNKTLVEELLKKEYELKKP
ncbi:MAG: PHP domain-containing protein [Ruminococcaceae bacterium]|nr:PHP domain-containing protein [Oscillospiraceae bacterium]